MSEMDKLVLYQKMYDLILYSFPIINRFPKSQKFVLGQLIQNCMLGISALLARTAKTKKEGLLLVAVVGECNNPFFL